MSIIDKLIGSYSERQVKKLKRTVDAIEALAGHYEALSDAELAATTDALKARLAGARRWRISCLMLLRLFVKPTGVCWASVPSVSS